MRTSYFTSVFCTVLYIKDYFTLTSTVLNSAFQHFHRMYFKYFNWWIIYMYLSILLNAVCARVCVLCCVCMWECACVHACIHVFRSPRQQLPSVQPTTVHQHGGLRVASAATPAAAQQRLSQLEQQPRQQHQLQRWPCGDVIARGRQLKQCQYSGEWWALGRRPSQAQMQLQASWWHHQHRSFLGRRQQRQVGSGRN